MIKMDEKYWISQYEEQRDLIAHSMTDSEKFCQCLDKESFGMRFYNPVWVVGSEAHIWSLQDKRLIPAYRDIGGYRNSQGEYGQSRYYVRNSWAESVQSVGVMSEIKVFVHQLVAAYFCDRTVIKLFGESKVCVHHLLGYDPDADCTWLNRAKHIQYILRSDHTMVNAIQKGLPLTRYDRYGLDVDNVKTRLLVTNGEFEHNGRQNNGVKITYHEDGTSTLSVLCAINGDQRIWL